MTNVATNHGNGPCKKISYCNIIQDKTIINTIDTSTILTCSYNSLLQKNVIFFDCTLPLKANMHVITVPPKIWRPKPIDRFILLPPYPDIDDILYHFPAYGLAIRRTKEAPPPASKRDDLILWDEDIHLSHLQKYLHLRDDIDINVRNAILSVIKQTWDAFDEQGLVIPSVDTTSALTGASPTVCC